MTILEIRQLLESPYNQREWKMFLQTHFTNGKLYGDAHVIELADKTISKKCYSLGNYEVNEYTKIGIFEVQLNDNVKLSRNRVGLRNLIKSITAQVAGAMVVFVQGDKWRFSYISKRKIRTTATNTIEDKETAPKRFTYLFGKGEKALTAAQRFDKLIQKQKGNLYQFLTLNDFEEAFSVEKLSKEFFAKYKEIYEDFVEFITGKRYVKKGGKWEPKKIHEPHFQLRSFFDNDEKSARDFFKRMLGRIVFLYFIQKKGWLAVAKNKTWGQGNENYLFELFDNAKYKECFYSDYLVPLFFDTLCNEEVQKEHNELRFPYLNGGLFDKTQDFKYNKLTLPSSIFEKLFNTFNEFNFTIYEDAPDEHTVAVDPEMLGHIFENLLEDNKDKGAFYTPKDIVHYMCRESLQNYIFAYTNNEGSEDFQSRLKQYNDTYEVNLFSKDELKMIDRALEDVKVCDPAIGSGAFPMGLLHEIYHLKIPIEDAKGFKAKSPADLKKHIIEESIYGVDIDNGAVDIARLRFWLSLVVDEIEPQPLPNLAFKIVCANTLIPLGMDSTYNIAGATEIVHQIEKLRHKYFDASKDSKKDLEREFKNLQNKLWNTAKDWVTSKDAALYQKLLEFNPFEDKSCGWFDSWWMFGVKDGFDIVIGNPPYVSAPSMVKSNPKMRKAIIDANKYKTLYQKWDLYIPFMEFGLQLLKEKGVFAMIVPYPLTNQNYALKLRELIATKYNLLEIVDLNGTKIFENATVSNCIPIITKSASNDSCIISKLDEDDKIQKIFTQAYTDLIQGESTLVWNLTTEKREANRHPDMNVLGDFCYISVGMVLNADEKTAQGEFAKDDLISETYDDIHCREYIEAKDIERYNIKKIRYLEYNTERCPDKLRRPTFRELYDMPKLMFNRLGNLMVILDDKVNYLHSDSMYSAVLWKDLEGVENKSISASIKRYSNYPRNQMVGYSANIDLSYLLGILNSKYASVLLTNLRGGDYHIYPEHIRNLPIPSVSKELQKPIISIVDKINKAKKENATTDTTALENEIDVLVYKLYDLSEDEISIIQSK